MMSARPLLSVLLFHFVLQALPTYCQAPPEADFATVRVLLDTGESMFERGELDRVAGALPTHLGRLIKGDDSYEGLRPSTRLLVEAFCTKINEVLLETRLVYRVGDPKAPDYRTPDYRARVTRFRDTNSDLNLLINKQLWPTSGGAANTVTLVISNSRRRPELPPNLVEAMARVNSQVIFVKIPDAIRGEQLAIEIDKELGRSFDLARDMLGLWRKTIVWEVVPSDGTSAIVVGTPKAFKFRAENRSDVEILHVAAKVRSVKGISGGYLLRGGAIEKLEARSKRETELFITLEGGASPESEITVEFFAAALSDANVKVLPQTVTSSLRVQAAVRPPPVADFAPSMTEGPAPLKVTFINKSTHADQFIWDFGDGSPPSREHSPVHEYKQPGEYRVRLIARGDQDRQNEAVKSIRVVPPPTLVAAFEMEPQEGFAPLTVRFINKAQNALRFSWDFGDGSEPDTASANPVRTFAKPGDYKVRLTVYGLRDATQTVEKTVKVIARPAPVSRFSAEPERGPAPLKVRFINRSENAANFIWQFGDGSAPVNAKEPEHTYSRPGRYEVVLTAEGYGQQNEARKIIEVFLPSSVIAAFTLNVAGAELTVEPDGFFTVKRGEQIEFVNRSQNAKRYVWDFGDGSGTSEERSPAHVYEKSGDYVVSLEAFGEGGQRATSKAAIRVRGGSGGLMTGLLVILGAAFCAVFVSLLLTRPRLKIRLSRGDGEASELSFGLWSHAVMITGLACPLECKAVKEEGLWRVCFRSSEKCVLERLPDLVPIPLEKKQWSSAYDPGEYIIQGYPDTRLEVSGEE